MMSIVIGSYINKILPGSSNNILNNINPAVEYYNLNISIKDTVIQNLKSDAIFMGSIALLSLFVVTIPAVLVAFVLKGMSIGYTINSCILALKFKSIKMILIILFKNLIIKNKGIEVNTSGYAVNQTCGFPNFEQVQRYYDLGGRIITIGTDSHTSDRVGQYVNDVKENLIKIGFEDVSTFTGRLKD